MWPKWLVVGLVLLLIPPLLEACKAPIPDLPIWAESISLDKKASIDGGTTWVDPVWQDACQDVKFKISVTNDGTVPVTDIVITDNLPDCLEYVDGPAVELCPTGGTYNLPGTHAPTWKCTSYLNPGNSIQVIYDVHIACTGNHVNVTSVKGEYDNGDIITDCDTAVVFYEGCIDPPSGLIAWWPLDSTDMLEPDCEDIAGPYDGHVACGNPEPVVGKVGQACRFNSEYSLGVVRTSPESDPFEEIGEGDFTIDAWIYPETLGFNCNNYTANHNLCEDRIILDNHASNRHTMSPPSWDGPGVTFLVRNEQWDDTNDQWTSMRLGLAMNTHEFLSTTAPIVINQWQHVAITVARTNGNSIGTFYLDGDSVGSTFTPEMGDLYETYSLPFPTLDIGHASPLNCALCANTNDYFNGRLDEVEIFDRALDATEIKAIFEASSNGKCKQCHCGAWDDVGVSWSDPSGALESWNGNCKDDVSTPVEIPLGTSIKVDSSIMCKFWDCDRNYSWDVTQVGGATPQGPWSGSALPVSFTPTVTGWSTFEVAINSSCHGTPCLPCKIRMRVKVVP